MSPIVGMMRGTSRERYITVARQKALTAAMRPGPRRNVQSLTAISALPGGQERGGVGAGGPAKSWRRVKTDSTLRTPTKIIEASRIREATKPSAARSGPCRLATE